MSATELVRLGIRVRRERADLALAALLPLLAAGAEESEPEAGVVEYAIYAPRAELPTHAQLRGLAGDALVGVARTRVEPGWERRWHEWLQPVEVASGGRRLRIRPPWRPAGRAAGPAGTGELVIDPGELFGAGSHPTTQLCLELLLETEAHGPLCDWGAGSGILAVAAARLGFAPVDAVELLEAGPEAIARNAAANGVDVRVHQVDLTATPAPWAPTVTANLTLEALVAIAASGLARAPHRLIASGVLAERAGEVAEAFAGHGLREAGRRVRGGWAAVLLICP